jgi:hypothetical protein
LPTARKSPEEWIGQRVLVEIIGRIGYQAVVRLDGINDWGIVVIGKGAEPSGAPVFFPWNRVMAVLPEDEPPDYVTRGAQE